MCSSLSFLGNIIREQPLEKLLNSERYEVVTKMSEVFHILIVYRIKSQLQ